MKERIGREMGEKWEREGQRDNQSDIKSVLIVY